MTDISLHPPMHQLDGRGPDAEQNHHQHEGFRQHARSGEPVTACGPGCLVCKVPESRLSAELTLVVVRHVELVLDQWVQHRKILRIATVDLRESQAEGARIPTSLGNLREESHWADSESSLRSKQPADHRANLRLQVGISAAATCGQPPVRLMPESARLAQPAFSR